MTATPKGSPLEVFKVFLRLGLTSFGGPVAHLGYFRGEIVARRGWLDERAYADLVALCQFLPGPASSQVGIGIGLTRAGLPGALAAWLGFTLPSAVLMALFGFGVASLGGALGGGWLQGLKVAAVAVVAQAVWSMARTLCPDAPRATLMAATAALVLFWPTPLGQVTAIVLGGIVGHFLPRLPAAAEGQPPPLALSVGRRGAALSLLLFAALLILLPLASEATGDRVLALLDSFYRAGSLVFGGGHVVLPLLQAEVVKDGWVTRDAFLAGYGAAQAVPGPLFTFAAYLGVIMEQPPNGAVGAVLAVLAIFLSSFLLVIGALPFWEALRRQAAMRRALLGINAAVVGILLAAFYDPVFTAGVRGPHEAALALAAFVALVLWKLPPWLVVAACALAGGVLGAIA